MRLRPFKPTDAKMIAGWILSERQLRLWSSDRFGDYPLCAENITDKYLLHNGDCEEPDNFYPFTAVTDDGQVCGHLILRYVDGNRDSVRVGFVIVDDALRGKGYGKEMLLLAKEYAFHILKAKRLTLGVFDRNESAYRCYKAVGFTEMEEDAGVTYDFHGELWKIIGMELFP